jgi:hypothetical protein
VSEHLHFIRNGQFVCDAPADAACRNYPDCECEYWNEAHDQQHPPVPQAECWMVPWIAATELGDSYADSDQEYAGRDGTWFPDGPATADWDSDAEYVLWKYADDTKPHATCPECGDKLLPHPKASLGMCAGCVHDAERSGWDPGTTPDPAPGCGCAPNGSCETCDPHRYANLFQEPTNA